ncbi:MAG TPA: response regulator transcription factor [Tepidisphaeraceae bacterium]|jgi:two-component system phosphate regulon response regulator PhoB
MGKPTVLVIDDEKDLLELVRYNLEKEHFEVLTSPDSTKGLEIAQRQHPDLLILDLMMPGVGGLDICRQLRGDNATAKIPILMLTAKAAEADRVIGLEMGADDYLTKPFSPRELVARVRAILRRSSGEQPAAQVVRRGDLVIDTLRHEVKFAGKPIALTATEFRILEFLASRPGRVLSRDQIIDAALGQTAAVIDRTIDVHITSLRKKLGTGGAKIETVRGFGYKFRDDASEEAVSM